jgi:prepilin-type N-terminal cleavage/methylation domain-containing protein
MTPHSNGYSLVELMITVTILGLLAGIALPNLNRNWDDERLNSTTKILSSWLDDARRRAIQTSEPCNISLNEDTATFTAIDGTSKECVDKLAIQKLIPGNKSLEIKASTDSTNTWWFTPRGTVAFDPEPESNTSINLELSISGNSQQGRCLQITAPLALLRSGKLRSGTCVYNTAF